MFFLLASFFKVDDVVVWGGWEEGLVGVGDCGCDEEEGISVDGVGLMGRAR